MVVALKNAIASHCFAIYNEHVYKAEYQAEDVYDYINLFSFYIQMQIRMQRKPFILTQLNISHPN